MKKWIVGILLALVAFITSLYIFIPSQLFIQSTTLLGVSKPALTRLLFDDSNWPRWWNDKDITAVQQELYPAFDFNKSRWTVADKKFSSIIIVADKQDKPVSTTSLNIIGVSKDSVRLNWEASIAASLNPIKRFNQWLTARQLKEDMNSMLSKIAVFFSKQTNVYGIDIRRDKIVDSTLISTYDSVKGYPSMEFVYSLINNLKNYTSSQNAVITGNPMLNIFTKDSLMYVIKVALPVNKKLPARGSISYKWMLPGGYILVADVKGDSKTVDSAFKQMEFFVNDYNRRSPAIPFLSLITDRMLEKDSSKWISRINYPVIE